MKKDDWMQQHEELAAEAGRRFSDFIKTIVSLRHPETGCPWDLKQTHISLCPYLIEEAYEAIAAVKSGHHDEILEELGDVLLQVVLHAQLSHEKGTGNISQLLEMINSKMIRRHPHVFDPSAINLTTESEVKEQWHRIKEVENNQKRSDEGTSAWEKKVKKVRGPASLRGLAIGKISRQWQFDWDHVQEVINHLKSEIRELEEVIEGTGQPDKEKVSEELGDIFFTLTQVARHLDLDLETVGEWSNQKFLARFRSMLNTAASNNVTFPLLSKDEKTEYWRKAKEDMNRSENSKPKEL